MRVVRYGSTTKYSFHENTAKSNDKQRKKKKKTHAHKALVPCGIKVVGIKDRKVHCGFHILP
jgi:hypothetical protein